MAEFTSTTESPNYLQILTDIESRKQSAEHRGNVSSDRQTVLSELDSILNNDNGVDIMALRKLLLRKGLPILIDEKNANLRVEIWKILLGVAITFDPPEYLSKAQVSVLTAQVFEMMAYLSCRVVRLTLWTRLRTTHSGPSRATSSFGVR